MGTLPIPRYAITPIPDLLVHLAEHSPGGLRVEQPDDDARVLPLEVGHRRRRVEEEALPRRDVDVGSLRTGLKVVQGLE